MKSRTKGLTAPARPRTNRDQFLLPATCFAAMACFLFSRSLLALVCFCVACLFAALGDLSPMVSCLSSDGLLTCSVPDCSNEMVIMSLYLAMSVLAAVKPGCPLRAAGFSRRGTRPIYGVVHPTDEMSVL
jgi:hypothetical protein